MESSLTWPGTTLNKQSHLQLIMDMTSIAMDTTHMELITIQEQDTKAIITGRAIRHQVMKVLHHMAMLKLKMASITEVQTSSAALFKSRFTNTFKCTFFLLFLNIHNSFILN